MDLRKMNLKDIEAEADKAKAELAKRILHVRVGEDKQSHMIRGLKRYISQINTIKKQPTNEK